MTTLSQRTFSSGEISPSLYARVDLVRYATGLRICRNSIVLRYGGVSNRPGTSFIAEVKDSLKSVKLVPFIFNDDQTYILEFGELYMRVYKQGVFQVEIVTPYTSEESLELKLVQSADVVTIAHHNHAPAELQRISDLVWSYTEIVFQPTTEAPVNIAAVKGSAGSDTYRYKVTAINKEGGEESLPGTTATPLVITGVTQASTAVVTSTAHGLENDEDVLIENILGMVELNGQVLVVDNVTANTFELIGIDSTNYGAYTSGGTATPAFAKITSAAAPSLVSPHVVSWDRVTDAIEYNIYREVNGVYGLVGISAALTFNDINVTADTVTTPPRSRNPFIGAGNYPSTVTYIQQRLAFANTLNNIEKMYLSRTGNFKNFTTSSPSQSDDAITFNMSGRQVNAVRNMVDLGRLLILTSDGEWSAAGDEAGVIRPTAINTKQYSYNGSGDLTPIVIDGIAVYQQARGSIIRDLGFDFQSDGYKGNDLTIFSAHLFDNFTIVDWAYQQIPQSILWVVRDDGILLGMTFVRDQQVRAWHRHNLSGGFVENVATVPEGNEDVLYATVRREINGNTVRYIERLNTRQITKIEDNVFMDAALTYDGRNTTTTTMTLSGGTTWEFTENLTLTASVSFFIAADVGNAIHIRVGEELIRATINTFNSTTEVIVKPNKTVPVALRNVAVTDWDRAVDEVEGLDHLEGEDVSVFGDGFVVASPNNESYEVVTVTGGKVTLDKPYGVIHVGLPYISDIELLDIDTPQGETISDKNKIVNGVTCYVEDTRGVWVGAKPPTDDTIDPLEGLSEMKVRDTEDYDSPVSLTTDTLDVNIRSEWNSNGRVFIRQIDPIPMTILSANPKGKFPFKG